MEKLFKDRLNCLKSRLKSATGVKLTKVRNECEVSFINGQIHELTQLAYKLNIKL
jgi:hypothetical protein